MAGHFEIAGYCRISVDDELDRENVSIENQKAIIADFVKLKFPESKLTFYEDRDRSGYTFEQREGYQALRPGLISHKFDILIVKDFSRFSRRNSRGLVELEDLRDAGVRIISIGDGIDFPNDDDWLKIQFQFLINEMPVTDASRKVRSVIHRRQMDGQWLCAAPYGYLINRRREFEIVPTEADIIRKIFMLYNDKGWGYKKIANYLTSQNIPTPRMSEQLRREAEGGTSRREVKSAWAIVTVQGILDNDFYIGTFRQGKYTRAKINGKDQKQEEKDQIVIENHHPAIIDYRVFAATRALREKRTRSNYRGVKKYDNFYSGFLFCGDCGSPMFSLSRGDLKPAYTCGNYHRRGTSACSSHHIRTDKLDELLKIYVQRIMEQSDAVLVRLNEELCKEINDPAETEQCVDHLAEVLNGLREELKATKRQRIRDIMRHPEQESLLEETYDGLESDLNRKIDGLSHQITQLSERRNAIIQINRTAKSAMDVFQDILDKEKLERNDLELLVDRIRVYEDHLELKLRADIDAILHCEIQKQSTDLRPDSADNLQYQIVQCAAHRKDRVFDVNIVSEGDPLEIYTDRDGEVIFKKYSPMGEMADFAAQLCDTLTKTAGYPAVIADRDTIIAASGARRRDLIDKRLNETVERLMENRQLFSATPSNSRTPVCEGLDDIFAGVVAPIISEGDVSGAVIFIQPEGAAWPGETEIKLCQTVAGFLSRQMES